MIMYQSFFLLSISIIASYVLGQAIGWFIWQVYTAQWQKLFGVSERAAHGNNAVGFASNRRLAPGGEKLNLKRGKHHG